MKSDATKRAFSALSISLLLIAVSGAAVSALAGVVWDYEPPLANSSLDLRHRRGGLGSQPDQRRAYVSQHLAQLRYT